MHGPHQVAQKSTSTTPSFSLTVLPKFADVNLTVAAGARKNVPLKIYVSKKAIPGNNIVTADVFSEGMAFREWAETIVTVAE